MLRDELKSIILDAMAKIAAMQDIKLVPSIMEDTVLLESGLDSLGFATLVASLDVRLGYDPFAAADEAYYPRTLAEFVDFYYKNQPN